MMFDKKLFLKFFLRNFFYVVFDDEKEDESNEKGYFGVSKIFLFVRERKT